MNGQPRERTGMWETLLTHSPLVRPLLPKPSEAAFLDGMFSFKRLKVGRDMCGWFDGEGF